MPSHFIVFVFLAIAAIVLGLGLLAHRAAKKRREALAAWAAARNWHFTEAHVSSFDERFPHFTQLNQGDRRYAYNVMRGREGARSALAFDYHYQTYSTDSKGRRTTHHHEFSAVIVDSGLQLTPLVVRAEGFFDKVKGAFGWDDIDFESAEFSRQFWVTSPDKRWAFDVLPQTTLELLLESPRFALQFEPGSHVIAARSGKFTVPQIEEALALVIGVLDRIPRDIATARQA
ncbi:MAG: hypothetical protein O2894_04685 [Planctomycetota bacterium]|nr:hypothetical protein [Planctomycetota bacterium]